MLTVFGISLFLAVYFTTVVVCKAVRGQAVGVFPLMCMSAGITGIVISLIIGF